MLGLSGGIAPPLQVLKLALQLSVALEAARVKARHPLSYADAFAVATGRLEKAPVLTGDPEILSLPATVVRVRRLDRHHEP